MLKLCKVCGCQKPPGDFYRAPAHPCKECIKKRVRSNRAAKLDYYREYDRVRNKTQKRVDHLYRNSKRWRMENPEKYAAHTAVSNALRDGRLQKEPCVVCHSNDSHAHHEDYSKPLSVIWLCPEHHAHYHIVRRKVA